MIVPGRRLVHLDCAQASLLRTCVPPIPLPHRLVCSPLNFSIQLQRSPDIMNMNHQDVVIARLAPLSIGTALFLLPYKPSSLHDSRALYPSRVITLLCLWTLLTNSLDKVLRVTKCFYHQDGGPGGEGDKISLGKDLQVYGPDLLASKRPTFCEYF